MTQHPPSANSLSSSSLSGSFLATSARPAFQPQLLPADHPSSLATPTEPWVEAIAAPCHFSLRIFLSTLKDICLHPERNSSLILRADALASLVEVEEELGMKRLERMEEIRVRLMPKQPKRDGRLDQRCIFYRTSETGHEEPVGVQEGIVLMIPQAKEVGDIPFYHPPVRKLAFRYESISVSSDIATKTPNEVDRELPIKGRLSISYVPFDTTAPSPATGESLAPSSLIAKASSLGRPHRAPLKRSPLAASPLGAGSNSTVRIPPPAVVLAPDGSVPEQEATKPNTAVGEDRLHRTLLGLLERVHRHGYGSMVGYQKRVLHDVRVLDGVRHVIDARWQIIVPRDSFQDLYLALKDRHCHLDSRVPKAGSSKIEDVKRHVFKVSLVCSIGSRQSFNDLLR